MKVSLICTTFNEGENITSFLESIEKQTRKPDEVVIVDSESTDNTLSVIKAHKKKSKLKYRLISKKSTRSKGRNLAIQKAKYKIFAVSDAGCVLDKYWLDRITKPIINNTAESVAGYYLPIAPTHLQKAIAPFVSVMPKNFDADQYLPSSRSVAFTKEAWEKAGKYPEQLNFCEDLVFATKLKEHSLMKVEPKAVVYWIQTNTYSKFFKQIRNYSYGDVQANYKPHLRKIKTVFLRYLVFAIFPPTFLAYLFVPLFKHSKHLDSYYSLTYLPTLQVTSDFAVMIGALSAFLDIKDINIKRPKVLQTVTFGS